YSTAGGRYVVRRGDTLGKLALHYHTTVRHLMQLNGLRRPVILIGQTLIVSGTARRAAVHPAAKKKPARVKRR
ncbi:MAG: LysM peptidoglycan-binding domain-containing protein, partial [Gemmatimonadaceae bacterium]